MSANTTKPTIPDEATVEKIDGRYVLRFERTFAHPVETVWDALTNPERITAWMGEGEVTLDLVAGGRYEARTTGPPDLVEAIIREGGEEALVQRDTILQVEPPLLFERTFGGHAESIARWQLQREAGGCRLTFTHAVPPDLDRAHLARTLAGWHQLFEQLAEAVDGKPLRWRKERWEELRDHYQAKTKA
jgi:uncharacterized protein YndB with AHSA1/START domain